MDVPPGVGLMEQRAKQKKSNERREMMERGRGVENAEKEKNK